MKKDIKSKITEEDINKTNTGINNLSDLTISTTFNTFTASNIVVSNGSSYSSVISQIPTETLTYKDPKTGIRTELSVAEFKQQIVDEVKEFYELEMARLKIELLKACHAKED
jgi:hypothetical protein